MSLAEWWPWALLAAIGVTALVALLYRRPELGAGWRVLFVLLRGASLTLLALLFADLACQLRRPGDSPAAAVVVDDSPSMSLADPTRRTRGEHAQELVEAIRAAHPELDWSVYGLSGLSVPDAAEAVRSLASSRPDLSAVVVVGDGGGAMPTGKSDYPFPVHAVAAGSESLFDVSLGEPRGPRLSLVGKASLFLVEARLVGEGPGETVVRARAREVSEGRREVELGSSPVELSEGTAVAEFRFIPPAPGWWLVEFETPTLPSEATPLNNIRRLLVNVRRGEMTALVVAGEPGPESAFLHRSLARLPGVESRLLYRRPGGDFADADGKRQTPELVLPDALFLVDLVPEGSVLTGLNRRLAAGRGYAIVWGRPGLRVPPELLASGGLRTLFALRPEGELRLVEGQARVVESSGRLFDGLLSADLPALSTYAEGLRDTDGIALVLSNPAGRRVPGALMAASGPPRAVFLGRGWWRWAFLNRPGDDSAYDLLVAELFAYVSSPAAEDRLALTLDRRRAVTGQSVTVEITGGFDEEPACTVHGPGEKESAVAVSRSGEGRWRGSFVAKEAGAFVVRAELGGRTAEEPLVVEPDFSEFDELAPDRASLALLASLGGGRLLLGPEEELPLGPGAFREVFAREPLRASPWLLGALILLVVGEWFLRRRKNLR